jgi:hypothetical protein
MDCCRVGSRLGGVGVFPTRQEQGLGALLGARLTPRLSTSAPPLDHLLLRLMRRAERALVRARRAIDPRPDRTCRSHSVRRPRAMQAARPDAASRDRSLPCKLWHVGLVRARKFAISVPRDAVRRRPDLAGHHPHNQSVKACRSFAPSRPSSGHATRGKDRVLLERLRRQRWAGSGRHGASWWR